MMKIRLFLPLSLLVVLLASCASQAGTDSPAQPQITALATVVQSTTTPQVDIPSPTAKAASTGALSPTTLPIATSRGPNLEATDPSTVNLASGQIQFVEFFRFT